MVVAERKECDVTELGIAGIARGVAGRPEVYPVKPTYVVTKMPIEKTDTSAYCDHIKVNSHMERDVRSIMENSPPGNDGLTPAPNAEDCVILAFVDGEALERSGGLKKRTGDRYRQIVPLDGPFHGHAHGIFAYVEMWFDPLLGWCAHILGRLRICKIQQTLDKNEYLIWQEFITEVSVGILSFLLLDVKKPSPTLYLGNPRAYTQQVAKAGGKVLLKFLKYAGFPALAHLYCARAADGPGVRGLYAYDFHVFRSVAHKPNRTSYSLQLLATYESLHPKLKPVFDACMSVSPLGRPGSNVFVDRMMEMRNALSEQRSGLGGELSAKLHIGPQLDVLSDAVHVSHLARSSHATRTDLAPLVPQKWDELYDQNDGGLREPIRPTLLNGAARLRSEILKVLGTDLTQDDPMNHFSHAGPVNYDGGDWQSKKPHKFMWAVLAGYARAILPHAIPLCARRVRKSITC